MADHIDMANDLAAAETARHIAAARQPIPVGEAGECDGCGEYFGRLVRDHGGLRCGFCRDGRRKAR